MTQATFEEFYPKIYNYVYYRVLHKECAEDITGDVFQKAIAAAASFDESRASYSTWLFAIAHNSVANFHRDKKNCVPIESHDGEIADDRDIDDALIEKEELQRLHALLATLTERERAVLALRFWGGFTHREIAAQLGISEKNAGVILSRAIAQLKQKW